MSCLDLNLTHSLPSLPIKSGLRLPRRWGCRPSIQNATESKRPVALARKTGPPQHEFARQLSFVAEKIRHQIYILVCRVIEVGQAKSRFKGL